ncbi:MAG: hypothetical protein KDD66_09320 [Bdellovibrionales bacterium]|nr:hypothetical protein [Bdellovibrionales bacterium]
MTTRFRALIIHPDAEAGKRLEAELAQLPSFYKAVIVSDLTSALAQMAQDTPCDAVFVSELFDAEEIFGFTLGANETPVGEDAVFVAVSDAAEPVNQELFGIEHWLTSPYTQEALQNIVTIAQKTKLENSRARLIEAIELMTSMVIAEIDSTAAARKKGQSNRAISAHIIDACKTFHDLSPDFMSTYFDLVIDAFTNLPAPGQKSADGNSQEDHVRAVLAQQYFRD